METSPTDRRNPQMWKKLTLAALFISAGLVGYFTFRDRLTLDNLAAQEIARRELQQEQPLLVYGAAFLIYVAVTGLSLPGAVPLSLACAWFFGFWRGLLLVSFASTTGATLAFLVSRYLLRDWLQRRFHDRLATFNESLEREGAFYLFMLRLIPAVPFFVINIVMGLTPLRTRTFWWVSQLGMLPGTAVYVYAGSTVPSLQTLVQKGAGSIFTPQLIIAFILLGTVPLILKKILQRFRPAAVEAAKSETMDERDQLNDHE